jgi:hypothetical protein
MIKIHRFMQIQKIETSKNLTGSCRQSWLRQSQEAQTLGTKFASTTDAAC